ncbi:MAG: YfhO family protein [Thermomicrobiales bacterium]
MSTEPPANRDVSRRADVSAFVAVLGITTLFASFRFHYDNWLADFDIFTYFLPAFGYVGERLRDGDIPAWNPYFSGGQPQAGDPGAGWMFLPAMIGFTIFDAVNGLKAMILIELLTAGAATYLFCRRIRLVPIAAMVAGLALSTGPMIYGATGYVTIIGQITPFLALGMYATESALQADRTSARIGWSALAGVSVIQTFLSWPQGFMYTVMVIGCWMAWRWLLAPRPDDVSRPVLFRRVLVTGSVMAATALFWGAAGILPRLEFSQQSNIPNGDYSSVIGGDYAAAIWPVEQVVGLFIQNTAFWRPVQISAVVLVLAMFAALCGRRQYGTPFFVVATLIFIDLSIQHSLTRWAFYLIPGFEHLHSHRPTAGLSLVFFPISVLAGSAIHLLQEQSKERFAIVWRTIPMIVFGLVMWRVGVAGWPTSWLQFSLAAIATALILLPVIPRLRTIRMGRFHLQQSVIVGLIVAMLVFPNSIDIVGTIRNPGNLPSMEDSFGLDDEIQDAIDTTMARSTPDSAAEFLQQRQADGEIFRYAPYFGTGSPGTDYIASSSHRREPWAVATLMNARAARLRLEQIGGYNPIHLNYYTEYIAVLNGQPQDYHWLDLFMAGLDRSPLLDMLNVRYVLVPAELGTPVPIAEWGIEVYRDELVVVYENPNAYERAWIVHDVRPAMDGQELTLFDSGTVDGRQVAFVEGDLPSVAPIAAGAVDSAIVSERTPESITIQTSSSSDGFLVVADSYTTGWRAYVDGERTDVLRTNHAFRGVALPAGDHEVVLRYEPGPLRIGLWSSAVATIALGGIWTWAVVDQRRSRRDS